MKSRLTRKQLTIAAAYLVECRTQSEIAAMFGMTQPGVANILARARRVCPELPRRKPAQTRHIAQISQLTSRSGRSVFAAAGLN